MRILLLIQITLLAACNSQPITSRIELLSSPPAKSFTVNQPYEKIAADWDNHVSDIFSMCLVNFEPSTALVKVPNEKIYEVRTRNKLGPYYGLIQLVDLSGKNTLVKIYDPKALPCFTREIVPFFTKYSSL